MPDAVIILDRKGTLLEASEMAGELSGYPKGELLGKNVLTGLGILDAKTRIAVMKKMALHFAGREIPPFEIEIHTKDRGAVPIEINPQIIDYMGKRAELAVLRDITERRKAEEEYKTIISTSIDGFWITDMEGHFLEVNDAYCRLIGYSREELLKKKISDIEAAEKPEETAQRIQKIMRSGGDRFETQHKRKDGRIVGIEVSVNYMKEAGGRFFVFLRDITERKKAEEELKKINKELKSKVEEFEKLNRLSVGRELKMIELKKRIQELESKPKNKS
jgi:PAS domain S-box-containing protein